MSRDERTGERDLTYSKWHRWAFDDHGAMIDLDGAEYCDRCRMVLAVIETYCIPRGSKPRLKPALVTMDLGRRLNVPAYVLGYRPAEQPCICIPTRPMRSADPRCQGHGIEAFRVERLWPSRHDGRGDDLGWMTPDEVARMLNTIRAMHHAMTCPFGAAVPKFVRGCE